MKNISVMFGGKSSEHEISIITALQAIQAMDASRYHMIPVYLAPNGKWYTGEKLLDRQIYRQWSDRLHTVQEVVLLPDPTIQGLIPVRKNGTLDRNDKIPIDICFLAFHGQFGEDGCVQGLLELADIPYTGCSVTASAVAMDKAVCKGFLQSHGIPVLPSTVVHKADAMADLTKVQHQITMTPGLEQFPLFIKPCCLGSSIGISTASDIPSLNAGLAKAFRYDAKAIVEPYIHKPLEINISILDGEPPTASVVEIPISSGGQALSYEDKYLRKGKKSSGSSEGMANLTRIIDPPHLDPQIKKQVTEYALRAFQLLDCSGVARFDFMMDTQQGMLYFNELNPIPGSFSFYLWEKSHPRLLYTDVIDRLIERATKRKIRTLSLQRLIDFKAL